MNESVDISMKTLRDQIAKVFHNVQVFHYWDMKASEGFADKVMELIAKHDKIEEEKKK